MGQQCRVYTVCNFCGETIRAESERELIEQFQRHTRERHGHKLARETTPDMVQGCAQENTAPTEGQSPGVSR